MSGPTFEPGDRVQIKFASVNSKLVGRWGTVTSRPEINRASVRLDGESQDRQMWLTDLAPQGIVERIGDLARPRVGDRVELWLDNPELRSAECRGTVTKVFEGGMCDVRFDDGDETVLTPEEMRLLNVVERIGEL